MITNVEPIRLPIVKNSESERQLKLFLRNKILALKAGLKDIHETKLVNWRRIYEATPVDTSREFPFHGASNLVVPVVGIHVDTLLARVMSAVVKTNPPWIVRNLGSHPWIPSEVRESLEEFLQYVGFEPSELDLYRVYHEWFGETIKIGTSILKMPYVEVSFDQVIPAGDGSGKFDFIKEVEYAGPRPDKIPFEDFFIGPSEKTIERADFKAHRVRLTREKLELRKFTKVYDPAAVDSILKRPDRTSPSTVQQQAEQDTGAKTVGAYGWSEWDIWECHCRYRLPNEKYVKVIVWYHESTDTLLRAFFNYYPDEVFIAARLFYRDDAFFGYGFAETLAMLQEELSQIHNQRRDNLTIANTKVWRVDPDSKLHQGYRIYPSVMLPAVAGEIEPLDHGNVAAQAMTIEEERLTLDLSERRSGVQPPMQGMGAGTNTKRGVYTAMGTLSLLQEGNTRTDLNISDIRYAHTKVGRTLARMYAHFGIGDRAQMFGEKGKLIEAALAAIGKHTMALPIYASSASINREVEKQNDLLLSGVVNRHYSMITQMMQAALAPMTPPPVRDYMVEAIKSADLLMKSVLRHFGYDEVDRLVPQAKAGQPQMQPQGGVLPGSPMGRDNETPVDNLDEAAGIPRPSRETLSGDSRGMSPLGRIT